MSYLYSEHKPHVFTDEGQRQFLQARDFCQEMLKKAGAVTAGAAMGAIQGAGDSWSMMACVDRLVELGELVEIPRDCAWQRRVFVAGRALRGAHD